MGDVRVLLEKIADLKNRGLTGMAVAIDFVITNDGAPRSYSVYNPPNKGMCFKYFSEPPYPEELSLKAKRSLGSEYTGPDPENAELGEMPTGFHSDVEDDEHTGEESARDEDVVPTEADHRMTRHSVRKHSASAAAGRALKITDLTTEEEEASDGETLQMRKRRGMPLALVKEFGVPASASRPRMEPVVRLVRPRIQLPSAAEIASWASRSGDVAPPPGTR
ncbi:hypothetical protein U9M48_032787 [Paspalum notatum var. saurae]|uniref:Uncharacterized protein n=1 Tax=Paspalum notatum var. saurae TaxID=547442 RepID=A0AAQ3X645_PASNO